MYKYWNVQQRVPVDHWITVTTFKMCNYLSTIYFYKFKFYVPSTSSGALASRSPKPPPVPRSSLLTERPARSPPSSGDRVPQVFQGTPGQAGPSACSWGKRINGGDNVPERWCWSCYQTLGKQQWHGSHASEWKKHCSVHPTPADPAAARAGSKPDTLWGCSVSCGDGTGGLGLWGQPQSPRGRAGLQQAGTAQHSMSWCSAVLVSSFLAPRLFKMGKLGRVQLWAEPRQSCLGEALPSTHGRCSQKVQIKKSEHTTRHPSTQFFFKALFLLECKEERNPSCGWEIRVCRKLTHDCPKRLAVSALGCPWFLLPLALGHKQN